MQPPKHTFEIALFLILEYCVPDDVLFCSLYTLKIIKILPGANGRVDNAGIFPVYPNNIDKGNFFDFITFFVKIGFKKNFFKI